MIVVYAILALAIVGAVGLAAGLRILKRYERGEQFRASRVIVELIDRLHRVSLGIVTMPIVAPGTMTRDNVCIDIVAVLRFRRSDASIVSVNAAINEIAQSATRAVVGRRTLAETVTQTHAVTRSIREILDVETERCGVTVTGFTFGNIQLPGGTRRAATRPMNAAHEQRPKVIGEGDTVAHVIAELGALLPGTPHGNGRPSTR